VFGSWSVLGCWKCDDHSVRLVHFIVQSYPLRSELDCLVPGWWTVGCVTCLHDCSTALGVFVPLSSREYNRVNAASERSDCV